MLINLFSHKCLLDVTKFTINQPKNTNYKTGIINIGDLLSNFNYSIF